jgi:hypothetical protein
MVKLQITDENKTQKASNAKHKKNKIINIKKKTNILGSNIIKYLNENQFKILCINFCSIVLNENGILSESSFYNFNMINFIKLAINSGINIAILTFMVQTDLIESALKIAFEKDFDKICLVCNNIQYENYDGKQFHINYAISHFNRKLKSNLTNRNVVLIDGSQTNILVGLQCEIRSIYYDSNKPFQNLMANIKIELPLLKQLIPIAEYAIGFDATVTNSIGLVVDNTTIILAKFSSKHCPNRFVPTIKLILEGHRNQIQTFLDYSYESKITISNENRIDYLIDRELGNQLVTKLQVDFNFKDMVENFSSEIVYQGYPIRNRVLLNPTSIVYGLFVNGVLNPKKTFLIFN